MKRALLLALAVLPLFAATADLCVAAESHVAAHEVHDDWWIPHEDSTRARVDALEKDVAEMRRILLVGNGHRPMTERVASLEQALETQTWLLRVILGGVLAMLVGQFGPGIVRKVKGG